MLSLAWMQHYVARRHLGRRAQGIRLRRPGRHLVRGVELPSPRRCSDRGLRLGDPRPRGPGRFRSTHGPPNAVAANVVDVVAYKVTPAPAANAVDVTVPLPVDAVVVGAPTLSLTYSGTVPAGPRPTRIFAQLVDPATGIVVNNQITPVPVTLDGKAHTLRIPMETIGYTARAGTSLELAIGGDHRGLHHAASGRIGRLLPRAGVTADRAGTAPFSGRADPGPNRPAGRPGDRRRRSLSPRRSRETPPG